MRSTVLPLLLKLVKYLIFTCSALEKYLRFYAHQMNTCMHVCTELSCVLFLATFNLLKGSQFHKSVSCQFRAVV